MNKVIKFAKANKKTIISIIVVIVLALIVKRNAWRLKKFLNPSKETKREDLANEEQQNDNLAIISASRMQKIESIANDIYMDIEDTSVFGHDYKPYQKAIALFDDEVKYMGKFYETHLTNSESLIDAIDSQYYTWGDEPTKLKARLKEVGL